MSNLATITNNILADSGIDDINVVVSTGSYANPAWITSLAWTKITGAPANIVTGTGTTNYLPKFTGSTTIGNSNLINDASGNLGLGVTPSNFYAGSVSFEIGANGILWSEQASSIYNSMSIGSNFYYNSAGSLLYKNTGVASSRYIQYQGSHFWYSAPSGTAGAAISFTQAMTLFATGNLLVGTPSPISDNGAKLQVSGTATFSSSVTAGTNSNASIVIRGNGLNNTVVSSFTLWADTAPLISVGNLSTTANTAAGFQMQVGGGSAIAGVLGIAESTSQAALGLFTGGSGTVSEKVRITSGGNVGIATSNPTNKLTIQSNSTQLRLETASDPSNYYSFIESNYNSANPLNIYSSAAASYAFGTIALAGISGVNTYVNSYYGLVFGTGSALISSGTVRGMVTQGGNWLIGTTTDNGARLQVLGAATFNGNINHNINDGTISLYKADGTTLKAYIGNLNGTTTDEGYLALYKTNVQKVAIRASGTSYFDGGNVLIGTTTSGASKLRIVGLPTSASGLASGDVWNDSGTLKIA